jgi:hypothetical protein
VAWVELANRGISARLTPELDGVDLECASSILVTD